MILMSDGPARAARGVPEERPATPSPLTILAACGRRAADGGMGMGLVGER